METSITSKLWSLTVPPWQRAEVLFRDALGALFKNQKALAQVLAQGGFSMAIL